MEISKLIDFISVLMQQYKLPEQMKELGNGITEENSRRR